MACVRQKPTRKDLMRRHNTNEKNVEKEGLSEPQKKRKKEEEKKRRKNKREKDGFLGVGVEKDKSHKTYMCKSKRIDTTNEFAPPACLVQNRTLTSEEEVTF